MKAFFRRARKGEKPGFPRVRPHRNFFYASFVHDVEEETHAHDGVLAIDVGVKTLATGVNEQGRFYHIGGFKGGRYYNKHLNRAVFNDWLLYTFTQMLRYKCMLYGKELALLDETERISVRCADGFAAMDSVNTIVRI